MVAVMRATRASGTPSPGGRRQGGGGPRLRPKRGEAGHHPPSPSPSPSPSSTGLGASEDGESVLLERPAKIMSRRGLSSRREGERLMSQGRVLVDGKVHRDPGQRIHSNANISVVDFENEVKPTVLLNKPVGLVSTQVRQGRPPRTPGGRRFDLRRGRCSGTASS